MQRALRHERVGHAHGDVVDGERHWCALRVGVDGRLSALDRHVGAAEVEEGANGSEGGGVHGVPAVIQHAHIHAQGPHGAGRDNAERLGVERAGVAHLPLERRGAGAGTSGKGGHLHVKNEEAIERAVRVGWRNGRCDGRKGPVCTRAGTGEEGGWVGGVWVGVGEGRAPDWGKAEEN
jgi:hypothetical protein